MKILGIDQSLTSTGICVLENEKLVLSKLIASKKKGVDRIIEIKNEIIKIFNEFNPDFTAIENYSFTPNRGKAFELGELAGVIKITLAELGRPAIVIYGTQIKKFATGDGHADKSLIMLQVYKKYNIEFNNNNLADAFVIAKIMENIVLVKENKKKKKDFEKAEWEVLKGYVNIKSKGGTTKMAKGKKKKSGSKKEEPQPQENPTPQIE